MGLITPPRVELVYSIEPDVLKPGVQAQTALAQLIKNEAAQRASRGESLFFRLNVAGLFEVSVAPHDEHISLPRKGRVPEFHVRRKDTTTGSQALEKQLENVLSETIYPNIQSQKRFARLVGLKHEKSLALQMLSHFFSPEGAYSWGRKHNCEALVENLLGEPAYPVLIFEGPPGVGKSELARTIADPLARALGTPVVSYSVSLTLRGHGLVGELTQNIAKLMEFAKMRHLERGYPCLLLIDEADAILQKRDGQQPQHHEEQVGVNQFLTEFDDLRGSPGVAIILTTNLHEALDDAVKKRTNAQWIRFPAPGTGVRFYLLKRFLGNRFVGYPLKAGQLGVGHVR
jgi:hypothetical protein